ncbi:MAG: hypothetical protein U5Q44_01580 [Dehalococcoidia bacterium]|nr:hypothetical protein [Dehalococcoidia bacterium]
MDSGLLRSLAYLAIAALSLLAWTRERRAGPDPGIWPQFWLLTGILLLGLGLSRLAGIDDIVTSTGRETAREGGWYEARRAFQALVVGGLGMAWLSGTGLAIWRIPERRRRYLPAAIVVLTIVCFAAMRAVSLHHVDHVLYNIEVGGTRPVVVIELTLLLLLGAACATGFRARVLRSEVPGSL